jgi:hypothetical protein
LWKSERIRHFIRDKGSKTIRPLEVNASLEDGFLSDPFSCHFDAARARASNRY